MDLVGYAAVIGAVSGLVVSLTGMVLAFRGGALRRVESDPPTPNPRQSRPLPPDIGKPPMSVAVEA